MWALRIYGYCFEKVNRNRAPDVCAYSGFCLTQASSERQAAGSVQSSASQTSNAYMGCMVGKQKVMSGLPVIRDLSGKLKPVVLKCQLYEQGLDKPLNAWPSGSVPSRFRNTCSSGHKAALRNPLRTAPPTSASATRNNSCLCANTRIQTAVQSVLFVHGEVRLQ